MTATPPFDLVVIGSGPAGQKGAIAAAKLGKRVAVVDRRELVGGVCIHTGTIPSKTFREAVLYLTGARQRAFYGKAYRVKDVISGEDLRSRVALITSREVEVIQSQLVRNGITIVSGAARFLDPHTIEVVSADAAPRTIAGEAFLIACGTRPAQSPDIAFDGTTILSSDQIGAGEEIPHEMIVVGAGIIGLEYASILSALGTEVTLIDQRPTLLDFADTEIVEALQYHMRQSNATFRLGERVTAIWKRAAGRVEVSLESGKRIRAGALLYAVGRQANGDSLNLPAAGLSADPRGRIRVDENFRTTVPHIYAAGDVIGFPALASTSMEQGRLASLHRFGQPIRHAPERIPYGIYTIPEFSMVGRTEQDLTAAKVPYEVGVSRFDELARGQMVGDTTGMLKLLFDPTTRVLLGVHVIGESATELVHIGQAVLAYGGTIDYFRDAVFNYPTLAEAYKVAALDGWNKVRP